MSLKMYQVDAFAGRMFEGNPAAVVPLVEWLDDDIMQAIAEENNLAETVFFTPIDKGFHIRWFTPKKEVKLCGHATLASAHVLYHILGFNGPSIYFQSLSGPLIVKKSGELLSMNFPSQEGSQCEPPEKLVEGLGRLPTACFRSEDYIAVFDSEEEIAAIKPRLSALEELDLRGVVVSAPGKNYDFVARMFAPKYGIPEDPVTGSAYTQLTPYWAKRFNKTEMSARQISSRGGNLICNIDGDRVFISGTCVDFMCAEINVEGRPYLG